MPSLIAWLDADSAQQARMRDIIRMFSDRDSRDELGLGQVRDAISEGLFPGTTVLLTRARYLLFVPWCYQLAVGKTDPPATAERNERQLITALRQSGHDDLVGLLGARVGTELQTLPSTIYWSTLRRFGILNDPTAWQSEVFTPTSHGLDGDDEAARKAPSAWSATMPGPPEGFPHQVPDAFALTHDEAGWLRDRILDRTAGTMLAHLMAAAPTRASAAPGSTRPLPR